MYVKLSLVREQSQGNISAVQMDSPSKYSVIFWFGILFLRIALVLPYSQPWPIKVESIGRCCGSVQTLPISVYDYNGTEVEKLKRCLNLHGHTIGRVPVSIISYASPGTGDFAIPDIEQFSVYQRAVVAAYAENNRYSFVHMDENIDLSKFEGTLDSRWFKIKLLLDALNTYARDAQYLVWLGIVSKLSL